MIEALTLFAILGIFAGLVAGMFGVGGGIITVPFFVAIFIQFGFEEEIIIHMAVGTSLGCIVFTGISSAYAHSKKNAISYNFLKPLASGIVIGAFLGALFAVQLNGNLLKTIIGIFALLIAILMSVSRDIKLKPRNQMNPKQKTRTEIMKTVQTFRHQMQTMTTSIQTMVQKQKSIRKRHCSIKCGLKANATST